MSGQASMWIYLAVPSEVDASEHPEHGRIRCKGVHARKDDTTMVLRFDEGETTAEAYARLVSLCKQPELPDLWWVYEEEGRRGEVQMRHCACGWCEAEREGSEVELEPFAIATVAFEAC